MHRLLAIALCATALSGCGGGSAPASAAGKPAAAAPSKSAQATAAANEPVIDVCALFPRQVIESALGKINRTRNLNVTDPKAPMRTEGGSGGCFWEGPKLGVDARLEIHTAASLARQGLGSPRRYIEMGWAIGPDASAVEGLGEIARTRPSQGKNHEVIAGDASRAVHLLANGISREQAIAIVRAGLQMKLP